MKKFFVDTCIWLNLFKKEGDASKGKPYFEIAKEFLLKFDTIFYSNLVLRELQYILNNEDVFQEKKAFMKKEFHFVKVTEEAFARKIEAECDLSFYDCLHIATAHRLGCVLVTRDKDLIAFSKKHVSASKPEDL